MVNRGPGGWEGGQDGLRWLNEGYCMLAFVSGGGVGGVYYTIKNNQITAGAWADEERVLWTMVVLHRYSDTVLLRCPYPHA